MKFSDKFINISIFVLYFTAVFLWHLMFVVKPFNFWLMMSLTTFSLIIVSCFLNYPVFTLKEWNTKNISIGIISAIVLFFIFYAGNEVTKFIMPEKLSQIQQIYETKSSMSPVLIGMFLIFPIASGEEIFWRGFLQKYYSKKADKKKAFIIVLAAYTIVHMSTGNTMLILAAFVCGFFWGALFYFTKSVVPGVISHMLWDPLVFIILPIQ